MKTPVVWYTRLLFWADGFTLCPWLVLIRPEFRDDKALLAHEMVHVKQQRARWWVGFWLAYLLSRKRRQAFEVEAYREQVKISPRSLWACATALASGYWLRIDHDEALRLLVEL